MISYPCSVRPAVSYEGARIVAHTSGAVATARNVAPVISAVDASGELLYLWRPDKAQVASVQVATDKARTAAIFRRPSKDFEDQASQGRPSALALAGGVPLQGGMPILHKGQIIGAIGVSGAASAPEDQELATIGAEAAEGFTTESINAATYIPAADVTAKFQKGGLLLNTDFYRELILSKSAPTWGHPVHPTIPTTFCPMPRTLTLTTPAGTCCHLQILNAASAPGVCASTGIALM